MSFAHTYFSRFNALPPHIHKLPHSNLQVVIVIPCYNEKDILKTLHSLRNCMLYTSIVEVIIVVNYSENASNDSKDFNEKTYQELQLFSKEYSNSQISFLPIYSPNLSSKHAGVGFARKIGMDEAVYRFHAISNPQGIIVCLDSDSLVDKNYIYEIETYFACNSNCGVANIYFEHPLSGDLSDNQYYAIAQYELHLRYYVGQLARISFPFAYHTVGSSCALRAITYCRQGGMNKRQAGEDFYFLQKLFQVETVGYITSTRVIPSSRTSDRVPFGTGYAMQVMMQNQNPEYSTYVPESFDILKDFFTKIPEFYRTENIENMYHTLHYLIQQFISIQEFEYRIVDCKKNSKTFEIFSKRFFHWFNGFQVFKFMNFAHQTHFQRIPIQQAASEFLEMPNKSVYQLLQVLRDNKV